MLRSQAGPGAGAWLRAIPSASGHPVRCQHHLHAATLHPRPPPQAPAAPPPHGRTVWPRCGNTRMRRETRRLRWPYGSLPQNRRPPSPRSPLRTGVDPSLPRSVGPDGRVVPQQWLAATRYHRAGGFGGRPAPTWPRRLPRLPLGQALCVDVTMVAPLTRAGRPCSRAADTDGAALTTARHRKHARYPGLLQPGPHRLIVLACETGGRWRSECHSFLRRRRWWAILSCAQQRALASTLLGSLWVAPPLPCETEPTFADTISWTEPAGPSLMPLR